MEVTFYNIGQGNCTLITKPNETTVLLDAGFSKAPVDDLGCKNAIAQIVKKMVDSCPTKTAIIVASHSDRDHINLMPKIGEQLIEEGFSLEFILGGSKEHYEKQDGKKLLDFINNNSIECFSTFVGSIPEKVRIKRLQEKLPDFFQVLSAKANDKDVNNTSIVIRTIDGSFSTFLPGDATGIITNAIPLDKKKSAPNGTQQLSHHGSDTHGCTTDSLIEEVDAKTYIISTGNTAEPLYHPRFEPVQCAVKSCVQRGLTAPYHTLTYAHENPAARPSKNNPNPRFIVLPYLSTNHELNFPRIAQYTNGFCLGATNCPIYSTADSGTITCTEEDVTVNQPESLQTKLSICALKGINNHNFKLINCLTLVNMQITSSNLKDYLLELPKSLEYLDLRNNTIGHKGIEHLIALYNNHKKNLIVKLSDNCKIDKKDISTICKKDAIKAITSKNRIIATFNKKGLAKDRVESLEFSRGHNSQPPMQHAQAKAYAQDSAEKSDEASKNTLAVAADDGEELLYELSHDDKNLYIEHSDQSQEGLNYEWPGITDICLLFDTNQTVAGITTKERSTLFDFVNNEFKELVGRFRYTNPKKPWKTIGKEFWSLDTPEVPYYHERTPFSNNGKFVMTVSAKNKGINIYQIDPLSFDPRHVKLHKSVSEEEFKNDLGHTIADIKRIEFCDADHSIQCHFTDKSSGELRYILEPNEI